MKSSVMTFASKCFWRHNGGSGKTSIKKGELVSLLCVRLFFLVLFFVSSAHCQGWQRSYYRTKMPYNFTSGPELRLAQSPKPYTNYARKYSTTWNPPFRIRDEERRIRFNYVDYDRPRNFRTRWLLESDKNILVGFTHDPYRYSVNKVDYTKDIASIRNVTSNEIQTSSEVTDTRESGRSNLASSFKSQLLNATEPQDNRTESRGKRGVIHLYNMISCATGCDPISYKGYGCYCGFLGSGRATDGVDRCCKLHDQCYEGIYCPFFTVYFQPYYWTCYRGEPLCALENHETSGQLINGCAARLCECDRKLAMCLRKYRCPKNRALCRSSPLRLLQNLIMA